MAAWSGVFFTVALWWEGACVLLSGKLPACSIQCSNLPTWKRSRFHNFLFLAVARGLLTLGISQFLVSSFTFIQLLQLQHPNELPPLLCRTARSPG